MRSISKEHKKIAAIILAALVVIGVGVAFAVKSDKSSEATTVPSQPPAASQNASLKSGDYMFDVVGGGPSPVMIVADDPDTVTMVRPVNQNNPSEFRVTMKRQGDIYVGEVDNPVGVVCQADGQPRATRNKYTMKPDGTDGLVEVIGEPCGKGVANLPLRFDLVPVPA